MAIACFPGLVLDCPDPTVLATFYGATKHDHRPGTRLRVFLDPARHPFCLCLD